MKKLLLLAVLLVSTSCQKNAVKAPVPGAINTLDATSYRAIADAQSVIHSAKIWEQCTDKSFPQSLDVDGIMETCNATTGPFPMNYKPDLNKAIDAYNLASSLGRAYHSGASQDTAGLSAAVASLSSAVSTLLSHLGGK
jgi:hypothetical protein